MKKIALLHVLLLTISSASAATAPSNLNFDYLHPVYADGQCYTSMVAHSCEPPALIQTAAAGEARLEQSAAAAQPDEGEAAPVPEPHTLTMMLIGLVLLGFSSSRREGSDKFSA